MSDRPPVLLIPGWSDRATRLRPARDYLVSRGWRREAVALLEFRDRFGSNVEHAAEIEAAVERLRAATGEERVAAVAHSMGGLALRWYLTHADAPPVRTAVFAGTPHSGTWIAWLAWGGGAPEMRPGSTFLRELNERALPAHVRAVCLRTPIDTHILPGRSAWLEGTECRLVSRPTHRRMLRQRRSLAVVTDVLLERGVD